MHDSFLTTAQVSEATKVHYKWLLQLRKRYPSFPQPVAVAVKGRALLWPATVIDDIPRWIKANLKTQAKGGLEERILSHLKWVDKWYTHPNGYKSQCLEWQRALTHGYGMLNDYNAGRSHLIHRWLYERCFGPLPKRTPAGERLELDHLCRNRACANPGHLELVTTRTNSVMRGMNPTAIAHRTNICVSGQHELTEDNIYRWHGKRACKACHIERARRRRRQDRSAP